MKKTYKKHISLLLALLIVSLSAVGCLLVFAEDDIEINSVNFPDTNFRNAIAFMYDIDNNGYLSKSERNTDTMIVSGVIEMYAFENDLEEDELVINDLKGIEYFENLKALRCSSVGSIQTLDLSSLSELETLACNDLGLTSIDLSDNRALKNLSICSNNITELDLSENTALQKVHCYSNDYLANLNISGLESLEDLRCDCCALSSLDLSTNTALSYLNCSYNHLTKLDLSANTALVSNGNDITEYNIGHQSSQAFVSANDEVIFVSMDLPENRVVSTSLDTEDTVSFTEGMFYTDDFENMEQGIDYFYNTGISDSALMSVHLDVSEKEHYYKLFDFDCDKNAATIKCRICKDSFNESFFDAINSRIGSDNYSEHLDVTQDGIINAKDYSKLIKMFS